MNDVRMFSSCKRDWKALRASHLVSKLTVQVMTFLLLIICMYCFIIYDQPNRRKQDIIESANSSPSSFLIQSRLLTRSHEQECREVHFAPDQCSFMLDHCKDDEAGLVPYMSLYFCSFANMKPLGFLILVIWLTSLFAAIGISASDFLCINLATIADMLGMSETLAGVTFLAFGNGSPDVFSTWAAFNTHNGSLAIGELIGAAGFITTVIAGSMAIVQPFHVSKKSFIRDVAFFTVATAFSLAFLADGHLTLWESAIMVAFYLVYATTVLLWHSMAYARKQQRSQQAHDREHFNGTDPLTRNDSCRRSSSSDLNLNEITAPHLHDDLCYSPIQYQAGSTTSNNDDSDNEEDHRRFFVEMSQEIRRTHRRTLSRMTSSGRSIRPSLLGAMEFGSVLASLQRNGNSLESHPPARRHSHHDFNFAGSSASTTPAMHSALTRERSCISADPDDRAYRMDSAGVLGSGSRIRSASANVADFLRADPPSRHSTDLYPRSGGQRLDLSVPPTHSIVTCAQSEGDRSPVPTIVLNDGVVLPSSLQSEFDAAVLQPFPPYRDEPLHMLSSVEETPVDEIALRYYEGTPNRSFCSQLRFMVPSLTELRQTLFPALEGWQSQSLFAKVIGLATAPTVLALTLTVPVVNVGLIHADVRRNDVPGAKRSHNDDRKRYQNEPASNYGTMAPSSTSRMMPGYHIPAVSAPEYNDEHEEWPDLETLPGTAFNEHASALPQTESELLYKPWLTSIQILTAPFFFLMAFFADNSSDLAELVEWTIYVLVGSFICLVLFISVVTFDRPPRWQAILAFPGFCVSIAWVSLIAGEVVGVLKTIGVITQISDAILGLTIFAVGNSLSDLLANLAIARLGYPVMALSACFGGPMLNILLGIGLGGLSLTIKKSHKHTFHGHPPLDTHFGIQVGRSLMISGAGLLFTLVGLLVAVPLNGWRMDRKIGVTLICIWCFVTATNIVLELTQ